MPVQDNDLLLVSRNGTNYKMPVEAVVNLLATPSLTSVFVADPFYDPDLVVNYPPPSN